MPVYIILIADVSICVIIIDVVIFIVEVYNYANLRITSSY